MAKFLNLGNHTLVNVDEIAYICDITLVPKSARSEGVDLSLGRSVPATVVALVNGMVLLSPRRPRTVALALLKALNEEQEETENAP